MAKESKQKILHLFENTKEVNIKCNKLNNYQPKQIGNNSLKTNRVIILADGESNPFTPEAIYNYRFVNLQDTDLRYIRPVALLTTEAGFSFEDDFLYFTVYHFWQKIATGHELRFRTSSYLMSLTLGRAPVYLTLKLFIYNDRVYNTIQQMRQ